MSMLQLLLSMKKKLLLSMKQLVLEEDSGIKETTGVSPVDLEGKEGEEEGEVELIKLNALNHLFTFKDAISVLVI